MTGRYPNKALSVYPKSNLNYPLDTVGNMVYTSIMNQENKVHKFELAGLGKAPFYFVEAKELHYGNASVGQDFGGSCEYCGHYIRVGFFVKSSDNKTFVVGSDCIKKVGDKGLIKRVNQELAEKKRKADSAAVSELRQAVIDRNEEVVSLLDSQPHPFMTGKTMFEYADYIFTHGWTITSGKRVLTAFRKAKKI